MKKFIFTLLFACGLMAANAQTIDTAYHFAPAAKVTPFYNNPRTDASQVTDVVVLNGNFDFQAKQAVVRYAFYSSPTGGPLYVDQVTISGSDFVAAQAATNKLTYFFTYLASHLPGQLTYQ